MASGEMQRGQLPNKAFKRTKARNAGLALAVVAAAGSIFTSQSARAVTYYWDNNGTTTGFGTASGTWAAPTVGNATQGWSTDATGVLATGASITTTTADTLNFGTGTAGGGLALGSIAVSGTVDAGPINFGSLSGAITLATGGTINLAAAETITVNNALDTINSNLTGAATSFTKAGTGNLTLGGTNTYSGPTAINAGILQFNTAASIGGSGASVTVASGASTAAGYAMDQAFLNRLVTTSAGNVLLGATTSNNLDFSAFGSLNSFGATGTFDYTGTTLTPSGSTYRLGGGGGTLGITNANVLTGATNLVATGNTVQLREAQNYSGSTTVIGGTLELRGAGTAGSILNTSGITVNPGATFLLTNDITNGVNTNRVADGTAITLNGNAATFNFGSSTAASTIFSETVGQLNIASGLNQVTTTAATGAGSSSTLTFASLNRTAGTVLRFNTLATTLGAAPNEVLFTTPPTLDGGNLIGGWATIASTDFATYGANGVAPATYTANAEPNWVSTDNVKLTTGTTTLTGARQINSLNIQLAANTTLDLGTFTLRVQSGGILLAGASVSGNIQNGNLTAGAGANTAGELILIPTQGNTRPLVITANIVDNGTGVVSLVSAGLATTPNTLTPLVANTYTGTTTVASGELRLGNSVALTNGKALTVTAGATFNTAGFNATVDALSGAGTVNQFGGAGTSTLTLGSGGGSGTFTGNFGQTSTARILNIVKNGAGTQVLAGTHNIGTAAGNFTIANGTFQFAKTASLYNNNTAGWTAGNLRVASGATLAFSVGGTGEFTTGNVTTLLTNLAASTSATNGMNAGSILGFDTTNAAGGNFTITDVIADTTGASGGSRGLTKLGTNTLRFTNTNTYTGTTTISGGTLQLGDGTVGNDGTISNSLSIVNNANLTYNRFATSGLSYGGVISGSGSVTKTGNGTQGLTGANTYNGNTTISAGKLRITNISGSATGTGLVALSGGTTTTLAGTGFSTGALTVTAGSRIAPAINTVDADASGNTNFGVAGTLSLGTTGGTTLTNANLDFDLDGTAAGTSDKIATGALALTTVNFTFNALVAGTLDTSAPYVLATTTGVTGDPTTITTTFLGGLVGNYTASYTVDGGNNLDVTFTAVPEPTSLGLLGLGGAMLLGRRRRRVVTTA